LFEYKKFEIMPGLS